jgi:lipopolysaccharide transport system permease protein
MDHRSENPQVVYEPEQRIRTGFMTCWKLMFMSLVGSRTLIWLLFKRNITASYKQSALGVVWVILAPVIGIVSWVFMNYAGVVDPGDVGVSYPVFLLFGTAIWGLFMGFYSAAATSFTSDGTLMLQAKFPHEVLVAQQMAQMVVSMIATVFVLFVVLVIFGIFPGWRSMLFPIMVIPLFFLGTGIGMVVAVFAAVVKDVSRVVTALLGLLMFITPVIYSHELENELLQAVIWWNPLTYLIIGVRETALGGRFDHPTGYLLATLFSIMVFLLSWRLFFLSEQKVTERA